MIQPVRSLVLVDHDSPEELSAAGLILPPDSREPTQTGRLAAVGPDVNFVKVGDRVLYPKHTGVELNEDGVDYLLMDERDLIAVKK